MEQGLGQVQRGLGTHGDSGMGAPIPKKRQSRAGHPVRETEQHQDSAGTAPQETECPQIHCLGKGTLMGQRSTFAVLPICN